MHRSGDLTDEASRLRQFAWEQWENQQFAVLFRPGTYGLDRYVVKRYVEQVLNQSERWRQLSPYLSSVSGTLRAYTLTSFEVELMQKILDFHLNDTLHLRITAVNDQLIEYDELLDFIRRVQDYMRAHANPSQNSRSNAGKKTNILSIPAIHSSYVLPPSAKSLMSSPQQPVSTKTSPVKPALVKPPVPPVITMPPALGNKSSTPSPTTTTASSVNGHKTSYDSSNRQSSNIQGKSNLLSPSTSSSSSNQSGLSFPSDISPNALYTAKIDSSGWVQINNVFLPYIVKNRQRLVPYQVLVSCKILEPDELRSTLTRATLADITLMNQMIRDCKINNEEITEHAPLVNVYHVLIGTKNLVYVKILPKDNPTSKINRQYKSVLALRGGSLCITCRTVPFVCSSSHSYIPLQDVLNIYPYLQSQLKPLARVPRTHELDFLQLVQMYYDEKELPADTLLIDMEDLNQTQIIPSKNMTLIEHHTREKNKLEQQILLLNNSSNSSKRKNLDSHENKQTQSQKIKPTSSNTTFIRPPTGYYPPPQSSSSSSSSTSASSSSSFNPQYQPNHWLPSNYGQNGKTRWQ